VLGETVVLAYSIWWMVGVLVRQKGTQKFKRLWCGKWCTERFFGGVFTSMDKEGTVNVAFLQYGRLAAELFVFLL